MTPKQKKRLNFLLGIFLLCCGMLIIGITAFYQEMSFFVTPSGLTEQKSKTFLRLGGMVEKKSFKSSKDGYLFNVKDEKASVLVFYKGILPPLFKEGQGVVVEGTLEKESNIFNAKTVFAKHDETYMPASVVKDLKKNGQWQE